MLCADDVAPTLLQVRFTLSAASDEEMEEIIMQLRANPEIEPTSLNL